MNTQRADLLAILTELSQRYPDWRLGQLLANVAGWADQEIWDVEDDQLLEAARLHLQQVPVNPLREAAVRNQSGSEVPGHV